MARQDPDKVHAAKLAALGEELMYCWNTGKTDPSLMAVCGHDTPTGYRFYIERGGETCAVSVTYDTALLDAQDGKQA